MSSQVVLSFGGRDGIDIADNRDEHLTVSRTIPAVPGTAGRPGLNGPPAIPGENAGVIRVQLSRSTQEEGAILVKPLRQEGSTQIPAETEVPARTKLLINGIGGKGEPGRNGENGVDGSRGEPGMDATRDAEATEGGIGGAGGNAGWASDGGPGGNGGFIQLVVSENDIELLYGVSCDVSGGEGGEPGEHGEPGNGGRGGEGGQSLVWEDIVDHKYKCTPACVGGSTNVAVLGTQRDTTMDMFRRFQYEAAGQSALTRALSKTLATTSRLTGGQALGAGVCRCRGGDGPCAGCDATPVFRSFSRNPGIIGIDGPRGLRPTHDVLPGPAGGKGIISIVVQRRTQRALEGTSPFRLKLVRFDVEDGNVDGIFEPGEDVFIRRMQVQNSGGIITPTRPIPCKLRPSNEIFTTAGSGDIAMMTTSILPGQTQTSTSQIRCRTVSANITAQSLPPFKLETTIGLEATIPYTLLPVEDFEFTRTILLQYPLEIREIRTPATIVTDEPTLLSWQVFNKTNRPFGWSEGYLRIAKMVITVDNDLAELQDPDGSWGGATTLAVPLMEPGRAVEMTQVIRVNPSIDRHTDLSISLQLYISRPNRHGVPGDLGISALQLIETHYATSQVSHGFLYSPADDVLLVTNSATKKRDVEIVIAFLENDLSLKVNTWNMATYGGLLMPCESNLDELESILPKYGGKTVILFSNTLSLLEEERTAISMCDSRSLFAASREGTYCLFFGFGNGEDDRKALDQLFRPLEHEIASLVESMPNQAKHKNFDTLIKYLSETGTRADRSQIVTIFKTRFRSKEANISRSAKELSERLEGEMASYHFSICAVDRQPSDEDNVDGHLIVQLGMSRMAQLVATQAELLRNVEQETASLVTVDSLVRQPTRVRRAAATLSPYDKLSIISALPISKRFRILEDIYHPAFSEIAELIEISIEKQIDDEMQQFLRLAGSMNVKGYLRERFIRECLPTTSQLIDVVPRQEFHSAEVKRILGHCYASCQPQSKTTVIAEGVKPYAQARKAVQKMLYEYLGDPNEFKLDKSVLQSRRVSSNLATRVNEVTGQAMYFQENAIYSCAQSLKKNDILTIAEWDASARHTREMEGAMVSLYNQIQTERGKLDYRQRLAEMLHKVDLEDQEEVESGQYELQ